MNQQSNSINIIIQSVTNTILYFILEENRITVTTNQANSCLNQLQRHTSNNTHANENPMPSPNNTANPPAQPTTNQPLQRTDNPPVQPTNNHTVPLECSKRKNNKDEEASSKHFRTINL